MKDTIEMKYAIAKQIGTIQCIETNYGPMHIEDDIEIRAAVAIAVREILEKRIQAAEANR